MQNDRKTFRLLASACLSLATLTAAAETAIKPGFGPADVLAIRSDSPAFPDGLETPSMRRYLDFYALDFPEAGHRWGFIDAPTGRIFVQGFEPARSQGSLLFIHGYMSHSGCQAPLVRDALSRGWAVYLMDLPGHGLSDGPRWDIGDFEEYGEAASAFTEAVTRAAPDPGRLVAVGHSTGCTAWLIGMEKGNLPFERAIFGAPLVRSASWNWSKLGMALGWAFIRDLPRGKYRGPGLLPYPFESDPLAATRFPVHWVAALFAWNERNDSYRRIPVKLFVIQGRADTAVDWRYNLPFLEERFDGFDAAYAKDGSHEVFRYAGDDRKTLESVLDLCLGNRLGDGSPY